MLGLGWVGFFHYYGAGATVIALGLGCVDDFAEEQPSARADL